MPDWRFCSVRIAGCARLSRGGVISPAACSAVSMPAATSPRKSLVRAAVASAAGPARIESRNSGGQSCAAVKATTSGDSFPATRIETMMFLCGTRAGRHGARVVCSRAQGDANKQQLRSPEHLPVRHTPRGECVRGRAPDAQRAEREECGGSSCREQLQGAAAGSSEIICAPLRRAWRDSLSRIGSL